jgi:hypothetical protein
VAAVPGCCLRRPADRDRAVPPQGVLPAIESHRRIRTRGDPTRQLFYRHRRQPRIMTDHSRWSSREATPPHHPARGQDLHKASGGSRRSTARRSSCPRARSQA